MKQHFFIALKLTFACMVVFAGLYTILIWGIAQASPYKGEGETVTVNNKVVGYTLEGQSFTEDKYFNGRPSACGYDASASGASNKGNSNPDYLKDIQKKIDTFLVHNPAVKKEDIPSELVTASGSGLDPDISPAAAFAQAARISKVRNISAEKVKELVTIQIQKPLLGLFGPEKVNVLQLNIALDKLR